MRRYLTHEWVNTVIAALALAVTLSVAWLELSGRPDKLVWVGVSIANERQTSSIVKTELLQIEDELRNTVGASRVEGVSWELILSNPLDRKVTIKSVHLLEKRDGEFEFFSTFYDVGQRSPYFDNVGEVYEIEARSTKLVSMQGELPVRLPSGFECKRDDTLSRIRSCFERSGFKNFGYTKFGADDQFDIEGLPLRVRVETMDGSEFHFDFEYNELHLVSVLNN